MSGNKWLKQEIELLKKKYSNNSKDDLLNTFNRHTWKSICKKARTIGLNRKHFTGRLNRPLLNKLCDEDLESYYWIGFILGDGCITKNYTILQVALQEKDKKHIYKLAKFLNTNNVYFSVSKGYVNKKLRKKFKKSKQYRLVCGDSEYVKQISNKYDIRMNKTYNPPEIFIYDKFSDTKLLCIFIGLIDADGCFYRSGKTSFRFRIEVTKEWINFLKYIRLRLLNLYNIVLPEVFIIDTRPNICCLQFANKKINRQLKQFALDNKLPILERKWDKIILKEEEKVLFN